MKTNANDLAFSGKGRKQRLLNVETGEDYTERVNMGLTKREYFASMVIQGVLANPNIDPNITDEVFVTQYAVNAADKLIIALNKETK